MCNYSGNIEYLRLFYEKAKVKHESGVCHLWTHYNLAFPGQNDQMKTWIIIIKCISKRKQKLTCFLNGINLFDL